MNDLLVSAETAQSFPSVVESLKRLPTFSSKSKPSKISNAFLKGSGLSPNTCRSYLEAVKQFYRFTKGLNLLQVRVADIEAIKARQSTSTPARHLPKKLIGSSKKSLRQRRYAASATVGFVTPYQISDQNILCMAKLRIEIERTLDRMAADFGVGPTRTGQFRGARQTFNALVSQFPDLGYLDAAFDDTLKVAHAVIHGRYVENQQVEKQSSSDEKWSVV